MNDSTAQRGPCSSARLLLLLLACVWLAGPAFAQRPTGGLVAQYPFDGNLEDTTTNAYDGQATGGPTYTAGISGQALNFDGVDDALRFTRLPNSVFAGDFTVTWYMNAQSLDEWSLLSKRDACTSGNWFEVGGSRTGSDQLGFGLSRTGIGAVVATARQAYFAPGWVHVAVVREGDAARVYVDGERGADVALGTLDFSRINALLGFSASPCIGTGGVRAFRGRLDDLRVYNRALDSREVDALASIAQITLSSATVVPGASLSYSVNELDIGTGYSLRLFDGAAQPVLDSFTATATEQRRKVVMPNAAAGQWPLRLQMVSPRGLATTHASTALTVAQGLQITVRTAAPQAGKSMQVDVGRLAAGRLQLRYAGRIVAGPLSIDDATTTKALRFIAPSDIPASLPANVELRAELLVGRIIGRSGTAQVAVAAPFSGPFARPIGVTTSVPSATPRTPVNVRGRLELADGATSANVTVSAYWVGTNGAVTPLPTHALALAADGTFDLRTRPAGLETMTAGIATGPGRIRIVTQRLTESGRSEWEVNEGPSLSNSIDIDAQTDITLTIRRVGGNINEVVQDALIVFDPVTPVQEFNLPPAPPSGGSSGYSLGGAGLMDNVRINDTTVLGSSAPFGAVNQLDGIIPQERPAPPCGPDLYRRYTDASGRASVDLLGSTRAAAGGGFTMDYNSFITQQLQGAECVGGSCRTAESVPLKFRARIYAAHRGAGEINTNPLLGPVGEVPTVIEFSFNRQTRVFTIRNLRTGQTTTQINSVNLTVQLPVLANASNYVYVQTPFVYAVPPALGAITRETGGDYSLREVTFSGWINFGYSFGPPSSPQFTFVNPAPQFSLAFFHRPDAGGSLTSARLYLGFPGNVDPPLYGEFTRTNTTPLCTLQDDGTFAGNHLWELRLDGADWRDPSRMGALLFSRETNPVLSGRIEYRNAAGAVGNYPVVFKWKAPPEEVLAKADIPNAEPVQVSDIKVGVVQFLAYESLGSDERQRMFPEDIGDNPVLGQRVKRNESATTQLVNITATGSADSAGGSRIVSGDVAKQYNEGPRNRSKTVAVGGEIVGFGPRDYETLLDDEIPLMQVTWGIPGLAGVDLYTSMRLLAKYWFGGRAGVDDDGDPYFEAATDALFAIGLMIGIDVDVLFGLLFDAGVNITGLVNSSMQTEYRTDRADRIDVDNCFNILIYLGTYFDPCPICPTPAIRENYEVMNFGGECPSPLGGSPVAPLAAVPQPLGGLGIAQERSLRRHAVVRFDERGNGGMLSLDDSRNLAFTPMSDTAAAPVTLSTAPGQRQPTIAYYADNRALAVWVESALTASELQALDTVGYSSPGFQVAVRNQRLAWSKFNGSTWSPKQLLTLPGTGEGFPVLEACKAGKPGCPAGGSVFLAFQRNINGNFIAPRNRIHHAAWTPSAGWTAITATPAGPDATQDITPSVVFVDGRPLLTWIRILSANQLSLQRRLMWQFPGLGPVNGEDLPSGANSLSLIAQAPESGRNMFGAFVAPETGTSIMGSGQAMYLLRGLCTVASQTCDFAFTKARVDGEPDSGVYGDRPLVNKTNSGRSIMMRVYSFTPKDPAKAKAAQSRAEAAYEEWRNATDPLHRQAALRGFELNLQFGASAELYRMTADFVSGEVIPTAVTADGGNYLGATGAYDTFRDRFVMLGSPIYAQDTAIGLRAQADSGALSRSVPARMLGVVGGLEIREMDDVPDLRVDAVRITRGSFGPSASLQATVTVTNAGSAFSALADGPARVHLRLGSPTGRGAPLASATVPDLGAGAQRDFVLTFTTPASAFADEENMLYASLVLDADTPDLDGSNNFNVLPLPGLPVPTNVLASNRGGIPATQLQWRGSTDPRVAGYRVYRREADGRFVPHGASTVEGFLDLSAQFGVMRTYAVASYSQRGVESPLSDPVSAAPEAVIAGPEDDEVFRSGFEALTP